MAVTVLAVVGNYAMVRFPGCVPFVADATKLEPICEPQPKKVQP